MAQPGLILTPDTLHEGDVADVLELINADRLPGQPACDAAMLAEAAAGRSTVDAGWWDALDQVFIDILRDTQGTIRGVVSYARRRATDTAVILWLHGCEEAATIDALVDHAVNQLAGSSAIDAFEFASALAVGVEALPVRHRPTTRTTLLAHGFVEMDLWRYMRRDLPTPELPIVAEAQVLPNPENPGWLIHLQQSDGNQIGEAQVSVPAPGLGVLWWITINPGHRGRHLGRPLLGSALDVLHQHGAREAILFVDDDAPLDHPERGRGAANRLYDRAGFIEVDRLCSYRRVR